MLRALARPLERCLGSRASGDGLLWQSELRPHAGGDYSIAVVQANSRLEDQSQVFTSSSATYVGVYDGHGGPEASRFVNRHLFPYMHSNNPTLPSQNQNLFLGYLLLLTLLTTFLMVKIM